MASAIACLVALTALSNSSPTLAKKPHIIYILADDVGQRNVGVKTPVLDGLRRSGIALDRFYAYKFCSPSRSSLLSGRLAIHVNQENSGTEQRYAGIPVDMTLFPERLQSAGYATHQVGKWHVGMASNRHIPTGRGFNSSFGYFNFGEDHYTQRRGGEALAAHGAALHDKRKCGYQLTAVDLWRSGQPAFGENGTYGGYLYRNEAVQIIESHDVSTPLFMFIAWQNNHGPLQVPMEFIDRYKGQARTAINGMSTFLDESVAVVVKALKRRGMWSNTLLVFSSDNGGMLGSGGDNAPLRGGKFADFEGGVRVVCLVAGGVLPASVRGKTLDGYISIADWYATFCAAAGVECDEDVRAGAKDFPPLDSMSMWGYLTGAVDTSPRNELPLSVLPTTPVLAQRLNDLSGRHDVGYYTSGKAIISGRFKLVQGPQFYGPFSATIEQRNCSDFNAPWDTENPGVPCALQKPTLYDIMADPTETQDLSLKHSDVVAKLGARLDELRKGVYAPDRGPMEEAACLQVDKNGGYWGPWLSLDHVDALLV